MSKVTALEAKSRFGALLTAAQREAVTIEKHGKPVAVIVSQIEFEELQAAKLSLLKLEIDKAIADAKAGHIVDGKAAFKQMRERAK